jgi:hypothetical protein
MLQDQHAISKEDPLSSINFQKTYLLSDAYESIKERVVKALDKYLGYPGLITFNDVDRSITYSTEMLIPYAYTGRHRVMLLFSNPHPHSVHQGMFLSPNIKGQENHFWSVMEDAGWLTIPAGNRNPRQLADICLKAKYLGPFDFIFYCYYAFPTDFPEHIKKIFGREYLNKFIEPEAIDEFRKAIQKTGVEAVVTFNKKIFNLVSKEKNERYIDRLIKGELIQSQIKGINGNVPVFLTFPTGWRYHRQFREIRKASLEAIRTAIVSGLNRNM